jgi:hypothetical protein
VFDPLELLMRLAAITPRPETNLLICHGLLAPRARWRPRMVAYGRVAPEPTALAPALVAGSEGTSEGTKAKSGLMHGSFAINALEPRMLLDLPPGKRRNRGPRSASRC